jgi:cell division protein FtsZ
MMGTGEGEGENRALEAAERAIANPLLEGVSMQGAKGVIISIIGGEDMKLLEVDEAANHIRELVDEDANIIWGSAFNPDLEGKIRVSVVATGIDASVDGSAHEPRAPSFSSSRAPKRPVLELPSEDEYDEDDGQTLGPLEPPETPAPAYAADYVDESAEDESDVDGIVDPLAGLRSEIDEARDSAADDEGVVEPADDSDHGVVGSGGGFAAPGESEPVDERPRKEPLDLTAEAPAEPARQDELLLDADRLAEEDQPIQPRVGMGRRRGLVSGDESGSSGGSTLFERMANLSRGSDKGGRNPAPVEDEDDDDDSGSLNIPRFLGRQNNQ